MRIALVASLVSPIRPAEANGPHQVIADLARGLGRRGHRVDVYAAAGSVITDASVVEVPVSPDVRLALVRGDGRPARGGEAALRRGFERLFAMLGSRAHDAVGQHAFDSPAIELAEGLPVLHTLHLPPLVDDVVAAVRRSAAPFVAPSEAAAADWRLAGARHVRTIRNGVPISEFVATPPDGSALIAGRISPEKGTHTAIRVALELGLRPLVVGDVYDAEYFATAVEPLLPSGEMPHAVPRRELAGLMARASVLLMPIEWPETFGLVAAEAQMAGCPVAGYRRGALPEIVDDGVTGYLAAPGDLDGLVRAARAALTLDRRAIHAYALAAFSLETMVDGYEAALREVARQPVAA